MERKGVRQSKIWWIEVVYSNHFVVRAFPQQAHGQDFLKEIKMNTGKEGCSLQPWEKIEILASLSWPFVF